MLKYIGQAKQDESETGGDKMITAMKAKQYAATDTDLKAQSIDEFSQWLFENLSAVGIEKRSCLKTRLLTEELLLRLRDRFGENVCIKTEIESSYKHCKLRLVLDGEPFNPLSETNAELGDWNSSLQTAVGLTFKYAYSWGKNILRLSFTKKKLNPVLKIFIFISIGVLLALAGMYFLPREAQNDLTMFVLKPSYTIWNSILNTISAPIIFFTVITTMLNTKRIERQGGNASNVVLRYFVLSFVIAAAAALISIPVFLPVSSFTQMREGLLTEITGYLSGLFPSNLVEPFLTSNTPQLLVMAFVVGAALVVLGNSVSAVKVVVRQINIVGLKLAEWVSDLVPLFAAILLIFGIFKGEQKVFINMWMPLLLSVGLSVLVMLAIVLIASSTLKISPRLLFKKIQKPFFTALRTGSLDASFEQTKLSCVNRLGIDSTYTDLSLPQGLVLYMPISAIGTLIFTVYTAAIYGVKADAFWIISSVILAVLLFVATPPVPGANLLAYVVFFSALGIPDEALMDAMIFDIVFGIFAGAGNQFLLQLELIRQAKRIGLLNSEKLQKE